MKRVVLAAFILLACIHASAATWECVDSNNGHKYRVSQDVPVDTCAKINDLNPYAESKSIEGASATELRAVPSATVRKRTISPALLAHSDSYCVKVGVMTASAAHILELGGTEASLLDKNKAAFNDGPKTLNERRWEELNRTILDNMVAYVFTVKPPRETARLIGYKKCLAGDFD